MLVIEYYPGEPNQNGQIKLPASSAIRIKESNYWILMDGSERIQLVDGAIIVDVTTARNAVKRARALPLDHPLYGENIPDGPFPAGCLPGDVRMNEDGSWDCHVNGRWCSY